MSTHYTILFFVEVQKLDFASVFFSSFSIFFKMFCPKSDVHFMSKTVTCYTSECHLLCHIPPHPPSPFIYTENVLSQKQHIYSLINNNNTTVFLDTSILYSLSLRIFLHCITVLSSKKNFKPANT
jgi:hypothetical protein